MAKQPRSEFALDGYVDVATRIATLREKYPDATLQPLNHAHPFTVEEIGGHTFIVYVAACYRTPDDPTPGIGVAWEPFPGRTPYTRDSELQNAETSAWGRAIVAALAADAASGIASAEEVRNRASESEPVVDAALIEAVREYLAEFMEHYKDDAVDAWARYKAATAPPWPYPVQTAWRIIDFITGFDAARDGALPPPGVAPLPPVHDDASGAPGPTEGPVAGDADGPPPEEGEPF